MRALRVALAGLFLAACGLAFGQQITTAPGCSLSGCTITGPFVLSANGAASLSAATLTGAPFAGNGTNNPPLFYLNNGVTQSTTWAAGGTSFGIATGAAFAGNIFDIRNSAGTQLALMDSGGSIILSSGNIVTSGTRVSLTTTGIILGNAVGYAFSSTTASNGTADTFITRAGAANLRLGQGGVAAPIGQNVSVQNVAAGTTDTAGAALNVIGSQSTGLGAGGAVNFNTSPAAATTGSTQNAATQILSLGSQTILMPRSGLASAPALSLTGTPFGGTIANSWPLFYFNNAVTQPSNWNALGTYIGINASTVGSAFMDFRTNGGTVSVFNVDSAGDLILTNFQQVLSGNGITIGNTSVNGYSVSSTVFGSNAADVFLTRVSAGIWAMGAASGVGISTGQLRVAAIESAGTKFTTTGCSVSATTGGGSAGTFTLGANTCTVVITMNGATGATSNTGWSCAAHDVTTPTVLIGGESTSTTTTATIPIPAGAGTTNVISFSCTGY